MFKVDPYLEMKDWNNSSASAVIVGHVGVGGQKGFIFSPNGIAPCLPASQWKDATKVVVYE